MMATAPLQMPLAMQTKEQTMDESPAKTYAWRQILDDTSLEHATVSRLAAGWRLHGTILAVEDGAPLRIDYVLTVDAQWRSRDLRVEQEWRGRRSLLTLARSDDDTWRIDGRPAPELTGCVDVDLGHSPLTNTLPIRRLRQLGQDGADLYMAWLRFPGPRVERAPQRYRQLGDRRWRYEGLGTGFSAVLDVDADGFVTDYEGLWRRIGVGEAAPVETQGLAEARVSPTAPAR
jgi:hypothetical protein